MRIFVTGGTGDVGKASVERLVDAGHEVLVVGRKSDVAIRGASYERCDVLDKKRLTELMAGSEAVLHLAGIPNPVKGTANDILQINGMGTFNVYEAALANGIGRVVAASSINALGGHMGTLPLPLKYLPVDEDHPVQATDPYSLSKQVMETFGRYFWDREGISGVMLRLPHVLRHDAENTRRWRERNEKNRQTYEALMALSESERACRIMDAERAFYGGHQAGLLNLSEICERTKGAITEADLLFMQDKSDYWTQVDDRDCAQAIEQALVRDFEGCHTLFINSHTNGLGLSIRELAQLYVPEVTRFKPVREGDSSLLSIERARCLLGFEPRYSTWDEELFSS
jgi:nucleoside-diphosphate-sugar epimerase